MPIQIMNLQWNHEQHAVTIGDVTVVVTATEYRLLQPLHNGMPISYEKLAALAYGYTVDDKVRMMMDKHIDRIRYKLRGTGVYIYCVLNYGYILMPETDTSNRLSKFVTRKSQREQN